MTLECVFLFWYLKRTKVTSSRKVFLLTWNARLLILFVFIFRYFITCRKMLSRRIFRHMAVKIHVLYCGGWGYRPKFEHIQVPVLVFPYLFNFQFLVSNFGRIRSQPSGNCWRGNPKYKRSTRGTFKSWKWKLEWLKFFVLSNRWPWMGSSSTPSSTTMATSIPTRKLERFSLRLKPPCKTLFNQFWTQLSANQSQFCLLAAFMMP